MQKAFEDSRRQQIAFNQERIKARRDAEAAANADASASAAASASPPNVNQSRDFYPEMGAAPVDAPFGRISVRYVRRRGHVVNRPPRRWRRPRIIVGAL